MKILQITPSYKPAFIYGGPTVSVSRLCESLVKIGVNTTVFTTTANGKEELKVNTNQGYQIEGVKVFYHKRLTKDHTHFSPQLLIHLWKDIKKYDVVHIHSWWNLVAVFTALVAWLRGVQPIITPRGMLSSYSFENENSFKKRVIHNSMGRFLLKKSILHATTELEVEDCHKVIPEWKNFILPNIINLPDVKTNRERNSDSNQKIRLIFLSRIDPKKGLELLFKSLSKCKSDFSLKIYGSGKEEYILSLKKLATQLDIERDIDWMGWVDGEAKFHALADADLFVLTSYNENFANVVTESLYMNTPVLVSNKVGLAKFVAENQLGWVTSLTQKDILSNLNNAISNIKSNKDRYAISDFIADKFKDVHLAKAYLEEYKKYI